MFDVRVKTRGSRLPVRFPLASKMMLCFLLTNDSIKAYFDNMVAVNLFHEPSFYEKLRKIRSLSQLCALLAAMAAWSVRFVPKSEEGRLFDGEMETHERSVRLLDLAVKYIEDSLEECGDLTPPICLLQATIIAAHCKLTKGVLGRAWRCLGDCVRLAYEMNLHLVDVGGPRNPALLDVDRWCEDEEKRRAWWAIWEMDVFATTIRRTPTALDWSQIETLLPVEDTAWFQRKPQKSCFLERNPTDRWKALQDSGNQSPKAWYIVINSLMKDAQRISSPRGIPNENSGTCRLSGVDARHKLETIANAVQCFRLALPSHLKYHQQYLGFDARILGQYTSKRQDHCSIYNIYTMIQLARLMIYRYDTFGDHGIFALFSHGSASSISCTENRPQVKSESREDLAVKRYLEAADNMLSIVLQSSDDHIQHINPFLSNTIWLASAVHLLHSQLCRSAKKKAVIKSRFEVMHLTYKNCVNFWDMHTTVQQNLRTLEERLEECQRSDNNWQAASNDGLDNLGIPHSIMAQKGQKRLPSAHLQQDSSYINNSDCGTYYS